ncbi:MAG: hypothetical protein LC114_23505 [Bryobacterales bacterium]|nr:hypothetical protein [Bryobacterales bacterium]
MRLAPGVFLFLVWLVASFAIAPVSMGETRSPAGTRDVDGDGLDDGFEQALLERFLPQFYLSHGECADKPAAFAPGEKEPRALALDGTIYGQAFPVSDGNAHWVELHYYHLWATDCGRWGHPLDAEHVSTLLAAPSKDDPPEAWRAIYWYAAAHEDTICDTSHGAHAGLLHAERSGARVWISKAKHASYLTPERCRFGCGGDECRKPGRLVVPRVVNLGEQDRPLNGALFVLSERWPLTEKLGSDFPAPVRQQLASAPLDRIVAVNEALPPVRATILAGEQTLSGAATGAHHTDSALKTGSEATDKALTTGNDATGNALKSSRDATERALIRAFRATKRFVTGAASKPRQRDDAKASTP